MVFHKKSMEKAFQEPDFKRKKSEAMKKVAQNPEVKRKKSEAMKKLCTLYTTIN